MLYFDTDSVIYKWKVRLKVRWKEKYQLVLKDGCMVVRHPGDCVLQIEVRVSLYEPLESLGRLN